MPAHSSLFFIRTLLLFFVHFLGNFQPNKNIYVGRKSVKVLKLAKISSFPLQKQRTFRLNHLGLQA